MVRVREQDDSNPIIISVLPADNQSIAVNRSSDTDTSSSINVSDNSDLLSAKLARDWAIKTDGKVEGEDYSAKYYAQQSELTAQSAEALLENVSEHLEDFEDSIDDINTAISGYGNIVTHNTSEFASSAQGALANTAIQPLDNISGLTNDAGYITSSALSGYATETWVGQQGYLTSSDLNGYATESFVTTQGYITGITSSDVTTALGYTPYNSSNPNGYTSNVGTVTKVNNTSPDSNGNVTISIPSTSNLADKDLSNLTSTGNSKFQTPLVSGTNIKTVNNNSLLGSGNIQISGISESYSNGSSWYVVYSNGFCIQGGHANNGSTSGYQSITVNLLKSYGNTNYNVQVTSTYTGQTTRGTDYVSAKKNTTFTLEVVWGGTDWLASGFIS